ncbi:MAG: cysteine peptidase family C39 domain-containing protein [Pseudomonas sp.]|uniref:cysteine peptidase family C39 domain-containing protein n=1 Tax=Pseudomonas sp. TaxID=306 RepID=UPI002736919A|nr:cysteine peptidase family C39 domain-containing protein [Pseudomonas sp.]MDP3848700.1 cysteine peptidase family C39 domain-containing protein [Pseudomonas sp.]
MKKPIAIFMGVLLLPLLAILIEATSISRLNQSSAISELARVEGFNQPSVTGYENLFKQNEPNTCGATALAYLLTRLGNYTFEEDLVSKYPRAERDGYNAIELSKIASKFGLKASTLRMNWEDLLAVGNLPVIAHLRSQHFVVTLRVNENEITYFDPAFGENFSIPKSDFIEKWSGIGITFKYHNSHLASSHK